MHLYCQSWLPPADPKATLLIVHGLAEHSGRYSNLVDYFVPRGYAISCLDHRGHGRSEGLRGHVERFSDYLVDLQTFHQMVRRERPAVPVFLVGHSGGGTIATAYTPDHQDGLAGLILSAPGLMVGASISRRDMRLARVLSLLLPRMPIAALEAAAISRDRAVVDAYLNDPLVYQGKIRARLGAELISWIQERLPPLMPRIELPILIMHGTADRLSNPEGSRMLYDRAGSSDKTLKFYDGLYHEILNEPERLQVLADMESWLEAHSARPMSHE